MLKISLIISIIGYVFFILTLKRTEVIMKNMYKDLDLKGRKTPLVHQIRVIIIFLIPIVNIFMLIIFFSAFVCAKESFYKDKIIKELDKDKELSNMINKN